MKLSHILAAIYVKKV